MSFLGIENRCVRFDRDDSADSSDQSKPKEPLVIPTPDPFKNAPLNALARIIRALADEIENDTASGRRPFTT